MSVAITTIVPMSPSALSPAVAFFDSPSNAVNILMVPLSLWALTIYFVVMLTFAGSSGRALGWLERRYLAETPPSAAVSSRPWPRFVVRNLALARASASLQRRLLTAVWSSAVLATLGDLYFTGYLFSILRDVDAVPFAAVSLLLVSCSPLLATLRFSRWIWRSRASTEWQVALAGSRLERDVQRSNNQDIAARRSAAVEAVLVARFRADRFSRRPVAEQQLWLSRLQPAVRDRAAMATQDHGADSDWRAWSTRWLDLVAVAFNPTTVSRPVPELQAMVIPDHRTTEQIALRVAHWSTLALGALGIVLLLLADHPVDLDGLWSSWDTATGRVSALITLLGGAVTLISVGRSGSR
ncbi:hypothetical protein E9228_000831 [Curtobacterium flaccumfaciens]|uniref:Uncharacterized protein n=1 Tax=Curtobacterium salicis TaxID=1779862 RepID=A0ABX0T5A5_9MICO|nr:hypothetical protein [Curtobacterium sp. WW7]NII40212.1 hypothetical protein [Curtobacterium sp. WW7]